MLILLLLLLPTFALAAPSLNCYPPPEPRGQLPLLEHCQELAYALDTASHLPYSNDPKEWGRGLPSTDFTEHLPKVYWLPGRGPLTCALALDAEPGFPDAREVFRIGDVARAATGIVNRCLIARRQVGSEGLGRTGRVLAKLVRTDAPRAGRWEGRWREVEVVGVGKLAWSQGRGNGTLVEVGVMDSRRVER
ncbi:MAG: hypothetical protein LQ344_005119 [Seirophora lacunosa]|nr:MAG: hypothetical protein LQ344_005119 [Seirophora lacunosa]